MMARAKRARWHDLTLRAASVTTAATLLATAASAQTRGETSGRIDSDGQQVTANIQLLDNAINLPVNFYDANNSFFIAR